MTALLIEDVSVTGPQGRIVHPTSIALAPGVPLALLGETGSGKSLLLQAVMGTLPAALSAAGSARLDGIDLLRLPPQERRALWGRRIAMLPQEPWTALDPLMRASAQVAEVARFLDAAPWSEARRRAGEALAALGLARDEARYPFQLSGGMCQRVALAATRIAGAGLLLADEPTKGLDAPLRDEVGALLRGEAATGRGVLAVTHDIVLARALGGDVAVMLEGRIIEHGPAAEILAAPRHAYTRRLLAAEPAAWAPWPPAAPGAPLVEARGLAKRFGAHAVLAGIDVALRAGERIALLGPSGSGKSTLGNILLGLLRPDAGMLRHAPGLGAPRVQKLYQDPIAAFAPRRTLRHGIEALVARHRIDPALVPRWLAALRLDPALLARLPSEVSGGELQRIVLMRAMLCAPRLLFADEPTSRLDPVTQQEVMERLREALAETGAALLLVTHDPDIAMRVADRRIDLGGSVRAAA